METRDIVPNEKECISQCIFKHWSKSSHVSENRDASYEKCLTDCNVCHEVFPQEKGVIEKLKAEKQLKKKQVMNAQCIKCHRAKKKAGEKTGPTTCSKCHSKG